MSITSPTSPSNSLSVIIPVEPANWQNAYNSKADAKDSLVIFFTSPDGTKHGRQYDVDPQAEGLYNCIGCLSQRRIKSNAQFKNGKLYMASFHDCDKISYDNVQSQQAEREAKFRKRQRPSSRVNQEGTSRKNTGDTSNSSSKRQTPITPTPLKDMNGDVGGSSKRKTPNTRAPSRAKNEDRPARNTESDSPIAITPEQRTHQVYTIGDTPEKIATPSSGHLQKITSYFKTAESSTSCSKTQTSVGGSGRTSKEPPHSLASKNQATEKGNNESNNKEPTVNAQQWPDFDDLTVHVPSNYCQPESTPFAMNQSSKNQDEILIDDDSKDTVTAKKSEKEPKNVPTVTTHIDADITIIKSVAKKPENNLNDVDGTERENAETPAHLQQYSTNQGSTAKKSDKEPKNMKIQKKQIEEGIMLVAAEGADIENGFVELDALETSNSRPSAKKNQDDDEDEIKILYSPKFSNIKTNLLTDEGIEITEVKGEPPSESSSSTPHMTANRSNIAITPAEINKLPKRKLKLGEYEFGVDGRGKYESRIIVSDKNNKNLLREYSKINHKWYCRGCSKKNVQKIFGNLENDIFHAPPQHLCLPLTRQEWDDDQARIKSKFTSRSGKSSVISVEEEEHLLPSNSGSATSTMNNYTSTRSSTSLSTEFREVDPSEFEYGMNENGEKKRRLAVHESDNRNFIREYSADPVKDQIFRCCNCETGIAKKKNDNFLVSIKHDCSPTSHDKFEENQKLFFANFKKAERLSHSSNNASKNESRIPESKVQKESSASSSSSSNTNDASSNLCQIARSDWQYGFDDAGQAKMRIIVFESDNKEFAHEYRNAAKNMRCLGCDRMKKTVCAVKIDAEIPIVSIPPPSAHVCKPRNLEEILKRQDVNRDKAQKRAANEKENSDSENEKPAKRTRRNAAQYYLRKTQSLFNDSESDDPYQSMDDFNTSDATASNYFVQPDAHDIPSSINDTNPLHCNEPMNETISHQPTPPSDSVENHPAAQPVHHSDFHVPLEANLPFSHHFIHPSSAFPERCCKKLNLEYSYETYKFWSKIHISEFSHNSIPLTTLPLAHAKNSGFAAVSLYLTGSENFAMDIKEVVIPYLFKNASAIGQCLGMNLTRVNDPAVLDILQSFTYVHFVVMAQMLECQFAVYENGKWMRYGSWSDGLPLYILELKDGQYSPVLSFKK